MSESPERQVMSPPLRLAAQTELWSRKPASWLPKALPAPGPCPPVSYGAVSTWERDAASVTLRQPHREAINVCISTYCAASLPSLDTHVTLHYSSRLGAEPRLSAPEHFVT